MKFTIDEYVRLIRLLNEQNYKIVTYHNWQGCNKCVVLRHDVDVDLQQALSIAQVENQHGIISTYFVLLTSDFYNIHSYKNRSIIKEISRMGHTIGLHFDEMAYPKDAGNAVRIRKDIRKELCLLSEVFAEEVTVFSYHRPTKKILDSDIEIQGTVNAYGKLFFKEFKYLSDSRMHWREPVLDIIEQNLYPRMQILTHPFWYHVEEKKIKEILCNFLGRAGRERYSALDDNFTNLRDVIDWNIEGKER